MKTFFCFVSIQLLVLEISLYKKNFVIFCHFTQPFPRTHSLTYSKFYKQWSVTDHDSASSPYYCAFPGKNVGHTSSIPFIFSCLCAWIYFKLSHLRNDTRYRFRTKLSIVHFTLHKDYILFKFTCCWLFIFFLRYKKLKFFTAIVLIARLLI